MPGSASLRWLIDVMGRTSIAVRGSLTRTDGRLMLLISGIGYLGLYLWGLNQLTVRESGFSLHIVEDPWSLLFREMGPFVYEPVAMVSLGILTLFISPVNLAIGGFLGILVGTNFAVSLVAWRGPSACRIGPGAGALAGAPALLSGVICCGPTILLILGIQASAGILAAFQWFLPLAVILLALTLLWVGTQVEPSVGVTG